MSEFVRIIDPSGKTLRNDLYNSPPDAASYIIFKDGGLIKAKNGKTGQVEFSGSDAATVIQQAIDALTGGGIIFFKAGTYNISHYIVVTSNVAFMGERESTVFNVANIVRAFRFPTCENVRFENIKFVFNGGYVPFRYVKDTDVIKNVEFRNCFFTGLVDSWGFIPGVNGEKIRFIGNIFKDISGPIYEAFICLSGTKQFIIANNIFDNVAARRLIGVRGSAKNGVIANNTFRNFKPILGDSWVIELGYVSADGMRNISIVGNTFLWTEDVDYDMEGAVCLTNSTTAIEDYPREVAIIGNVMRFEVDSATMNDAIRLEAHIVDGTKSYLQDIVVSGNVISNFTEFGIIASRVKRGVISNNILRNIGSRAISIGDSPYTLVEGNVIYRGSIGEPAIRLNTSYVDVLNNIVYDDVPNQLNAIAEVSGDYNRIIGNRVEGATGDLISVVGANTIVKHNLGYVTENSGTATIPNGSSNVTVNHGLASTPSVVKLTGTHSEVANCWVTNVTSTQFTINAPAAVSADRDVYWQAEV